MLAATLIAIFIIPVTFYVAERFAPKPKPVAPPSRAVPAPIHGWGCGTSDEQEEGQP